jgi:hypothetical protein
LWVLLPTSYRYKCETMKTVTGLRTIVKFYNNPKPIGGGTVAGKPKMHNTLITRTLGKLGVIDSSWIPTEGEIPKDGSFWLVEILRDTSPTKAQGVFVLAPVRKVETDEVQKLSPGMYDEESDEGTVIITPKLREDFYWILPLSLRKAMENTNAIVVKYLWE